MRRRTASPSARSSRRSPARPCRSTRKSAASFCGNLPAVFTGIVQAVGRLVRVHPHEIDCAGLDLGGVAVGDSIAVQGVCLTVTSRSAGGFTADVSEETLRVTTGLDRPGDVNLEKALKAGDA